jgi:uncharacterized membrane protein (UPF0127 family)
MIIVSLLMLTLGNEVFDLSLAKTPEEQKNGLMNRATLNQNEGMLFMMNKPRFGGPCMWMKDTLIPLDIIFIDQNATVVDIIDNAPPQTLTPRCPSNISQKISHIIELLGGSAQRCGLKKGHQLDLKALQ